MKKLFHLLLAAAILPALTFCDKVDINDSSDIITTGATDLTRTSATLKGSVNYSIESFSDACFIYDKAGKLNRKSSPKVDAVLDDHSFSAILSGLEPGTEYEYVASAVIGGKQKYGKQVKFSTEEIPVASLTIEPKTYTIYLQREQSVQLTAKVKPENATNASIVWSSSHPDVATVDDKGLVKAIKTGGAEITAQTADGKKKAVCGITVANVAVTDFTILPEDAKILAHQSKTLQLSAPLEPEDAVDKNITWSSSNESVATVNQSGLVTGVSNGVATITAKVGLLTRTRSVRVYFRPEAVDLGLSVKWASANLRANNPEDKGAYGAWGWTDAAGSDNYYYGDSSTLPASHDAAAVNLGGTWRLPTYSDFRELLDQCTWEKKTVNSVGVWSITSKKNGKTIIIPLTGGYRWYQWKDTDNGYYWTSSLGTKDRPSLLALRPSSYQLYDTQFFILSQYDLFFRPVCK